MLFSIWRMRSRVTLNARPTSSSVRGSAAGQAVAHLDHLALALGQRVERALDVLACAGSPRRSSNGDSAVSSSTKSPSSDSSSSPIGFSSETGCWPCAGCRAPRATVHSSSRGDLLRLGLAAELLDELALDVHDLVELLDHVDRDADRPRPCRRSRASPPGGSTRSRRSRTCSRGGSRTSRPRGSARASPPGSGRGTSGRGRGSPWRSRRRGAGWPRPSAAWRPCRRARCASPARPPASAVSSVDPADRAQVEAQRVEARLDREVDLGLLARRRPRLAASPAVAWRLLVRRGPAVRRPITSMPCSTRWACSSLHLLLGDLDLLEACGDLLEGQVAALLALGDELREAPRAPQIGASSASSPSALWCSRPSLPSMTPPGRPSASPLRRTSVLTASRDIAASAGPLARTTRAAAAEQCVIDSTSSARCQVPSTRYPAGRIAAMEPAVTLARPRRPGRAPVDPASRSRASASPASRRSSASAPTAPSSSTTPSSSASSTSARSRRASHMSRFEEVVNEAIDEVVARRARRSAPRTLAAHIAEHGARAPGRAARRGDDRRALPREQAGAGRRASRRRRSTRCFGTAVASERGTRHARSASQAQGMTACPCAQELVAGARARAARRATASPTSEIERDPRGRPRRHPQPARPRHAPHRLPRGRRRSTIDAPRPAATSSRARCRSRSTS